MCSHRMVVCGICVHTGWWFVVYVFTHGGGVWYMFSHMKVVCHPRPHSLVAIKHRMAAQGKYSFAHDGGLGVTRWCRGILFLLSRATCQMHHLTEQNMLKNRGKEYGGSTHTETRVCHAPVLRAVLCCFPLYLPATGAGAGARLRAFGVQQKPHDVRKTSSYVSVTPEMTEPLAHENVANGVAY